MQTPHGSQINHTALLFVVGTPRSGTSLLQTILACHPHARAIPESYVFSDLSPSIGSLNGLPPLYRGRIPDTLSVPAARRFIAGLTERRMPADLCLYALIDECRDSKRVDTARLIRRFFQLFAANDCRLIIEKTPGHVYFTDEIRRFFPEARFVQIVRDPRDVVCSLSEMFRAACGAAPSIYALSRAWRAGVETGLKHNNPFVRYEDLVRAPCATVKPLMKNLDFTYKAKYLQRQTAVSDQTRPSNDAWNMGTQKSISDRSIGRYQKALSPAEQGIVETVCREHMAHFGYAPAAAIPTRTSMLRHRALFHHHCASQAMKQLGRRAVARIRHSRPFHSR